MKKLIYAIFVMCVSNLTAQEAKPAIPLLQQFDKVRDFTANASGDVSYFTIQSQNEEVSVISKSVRTADGWQSPTIASFSGKYKDLEPFLAPDGLKLYFVSNRPLDENSTDTKDFDIWYVQRASKDLEWSEPINMGKPINTEHNEFYPAVANNGNLYFTCDCPESLGRDDIFFSTIENGAYTVPVSLGDNVNSEGFEYNSFISKDDSYLIFGGYQRADGLGSGDMYISFKNSSGEWSKAKPLPLPINSRHMDYCPFVDESNNVIYFTSRRSSIIKERIDSIDDLSQFLDSYQNGGSRLYKFEFNVETLRTNHPK